MTFGRERMRASGTGYSGHRERRGRKTGWAARHTLAAWLVDELQGGDHDHDEDDDGNRDRRPAPADRSAGAGTPAPTRPASATRPARRGSAGDPRWRRPTDR